MNNTLFKLLAVISALLTGCTGYVVEKDHVYYRHWNEARGSVKQLMKEADPETFETLECDHYGKDKSHVFYDGQLIPGADPATFNGMNDLYAKDKFRGYYAGDSIESSRGITFKQIDDYYSTDGTDVFHKTKALHVCSTETFEIFENEDGRSEFQRWASDGCFYYFSEHRIPSDDYDHVHIFRGSAGMAKDRNWVYFFDHKINFNQEGKKILDTVDATSFMVTGYLDCLDKFGCINPYHGREKCE